MKNIFLPVFIGIISLFISDIIPAQKRDYSIKSVSFTKVKLTDKFWLPRIETNRLVTIPASFERCDKTGRVKILYWLQRTLENFAAFILLMIQIFIKQLK